MKKLIRLYPVWWRRRYGAEMARLLDDLAAAGGGARLKIAVDVLLGALDARLSRDLHAGAGTARAVGLAAGAAVIGWLPAGALIFVGSVVFPSYSDAVLFTAGFLYLMMAFPVIGAVAGRACTRPWSWPLAGVVAGMVMAALTNAAYAVVDNVFLGIVSKQPENIEEFRTSGMTSMRDFINLSLDRQVLGITVLLTVTGLLMGTIGAICAAERRHSGPTASRA